MPAYIYNFIAGLLIGYYLLNQTFRALVNRPAIALFRTLKKAHEAKDRERQAELDAVCKAKEQTADSYALTKRLEADNLFKARTGEADKYFNDKKLESDKLGSEIIRRQEALTVLNDKNGEAEKQLVRIHKQTDKDCSDKKMMADKLDANIIWRKKALNILNGKIDNSGKQLSKIRKRIAVSTVVLAQSKNRYTPKITALQPQQVETINPTPQTAQKQGVATKDVILDGGKKTLWVSDEELAKWMANPDVKVSDKSEQE